MSAPCMQNPQGAHRWGTRGRKINAPLPDDYCAGCHRRYRDLPLGEQVVVPSEWPVMFRRDVTGWAKP